jgi:hypothetical protein
MYSSFDSEMFGRWYRNRAFDEDSPRQHSLTFPSLQTAVSLATFTLAMVLHPEIQRKARAHIAAVVTLGSLPAFDDEPSLPYISAIVLEVMRWRPAGPFGMQSKYSVN